MTISRRNLLVGSVATAAGASVTAPFFMPQYRHDRRPKRSRVAILHIKDYSQDLEELLHRGLRLFALEVDKRVVVLKPNLVDYIRESAINTHPLLVAAAVECFRRLGAKEVIVAEGPGHQRDTQLTLAESGYESILQDNKIRFVDLNRDELRPVNLSAGYSGLKRLWLPKTVLNADFLVSMPKVKTHHWSGVTLSMKNMFGVVPGNKYGWPKNILHWHGIHESILDLCATTPIPFVIGDAIMCMEGNGPLNGSPRPLGCVILADDPVAADATCTRLMGLVPERVAHLHEAAKFLGNSAPELIDQAGEGLSPANVPFTVVPEFEFLRKL